MKKAVQNKKTTAKAAKGKPEAEPQTDTIEPERGPYTVYPEEVKIAALEAVNLADGNVHAAANHLKIPYRTLLEWTKGNGTSDATHSAFVAKKPGRLASKLDLMTDKLADAIMDRLALGDPTATLKDLSTSLAILIDKRRLLGDQPTAITEVRDAKSAEFMKFVRDTQKNLGMSEADARAFVLNSIPEFKQWIN